MAFADPQSVTIGGTTTSLPRVLTNNGQGQFTSANGDIQLEVVPKNGPKTKSRIIRLRVNKITSDPLVTTTNVRVSDLISLNIIRPVDGFSDAEVLAQVKGFLALLAASSDAAMIKFIAGEN